MTIEKRLSKIEQTVAPVADQPAFTIRVRAAMDGRPDSNAPDRVGTIRPSSPTIWITEDDVTVL